MYASSLMSLLLGSTIDDQRAADGIVAAFAGIYLLVMLFAFAAFAFFIFCFWRIFTKAGYGGAYAFLLLIPGFGLWICIGLLAFGNWPAGQSWGRASGQ